MTTSYIKLHHPNRLLFSGKKIKSDIIKTNIYLIFMKMFNNSNKNIYL